MLNSESFAAWHNSPRRSEQRKMNPEHGGPCEFVQCFNLSIICSDSDGIYVPVESYNILQDILYIDTVIHNIYIYIYTDTSVPLCRYEPTRAVSHCPQLPGAFFGAFRCAARIKKAMAPDFVGLAMNVTSPCHPRRARLYWILLN